MLHFGDITKIRGDAVPLVDVVIGGSPCQDLSVAGKRAGLEGARSGLYMEQIRIIKEMRANVRADGYLRGSSPRYMVWENVPGAFSSNGGEDFRVVLEEAARVAARNALFLDLRTANGRTPDASWETDGPLHGEYTMRGFGESPNVAVESRLSQILEEEAHPKYYLSAKACEGILRRAERRGKELPPMLKDVLERQSASKATASTERTPPDATVKGGETMT